MINTEMIQRVTSIRNCGSEGNSTNRVGRFAFKGNTFEPHKKKDWYRNSIGKTDRTVTFRSRGPNDKLSKCIFEVLIVLSLDFKWKNGNISTNGSYKLFFCTPSWVLSGIRKEIFHFSISRDLKTQFLTFKMYRLF